MTILLAFLLFSPYHLEAEVRPKYGDALKAPYLKKPYFPTYLELTRVACQFSTLFELDEYGNPKPCLVESYNISEDGLELSIMLREKLTFHDHRELNAEAAAASLQHLADMQWCYARLLEPIKGYRQYMDGETEAIEGIIPSSEHHLRIILEGRCNNMLTRLAFPGLAIMPASANSKTSYPYSPRIPGSGAFYVKKINDDDQIVLEPNLDYFKGRPYLNNLSFIPSNAPGASAIAIKNKQLDLGLIYEPTNMSLLPTDAKKTHVNIPYSVFIHLNAARSPFDNKKMRKAFLWLIDPENTVKIALGGKAQYATTILPPSIALYHDLIRIPKPNARVSQAALGTITGRSLTMIIPANDPIADRISQRLKTSMRKLRLNLSIEKLGYADLYYRYKTKEYDLAYVSFEPHFSDPQLALEEFLLLYHDLKPIAFTSDKYSEIKYYLLLAQRAESPSDGVRFVIKAEQLLAEKVLDIYLFYSNAQLGASSKLQGLRFMPWGVSLQDAWISRH